MLELLVKTRKKTGHQNKQIRKQGFIPAILYGHEVKNMLLSINSQDFKKTYKEAGLSALIKLKMTDNEQDAKNGNERLVLIQDTAKDPVSGEVIHVDFNQVKMDEETVAEVALVFVNESIVVEREGGILVKNIQSVEVKALPQNLPKKIEVDISVIKTFDDNIHVKDIKIPKDVKMSSNPDDMIASVIQPRTTEELEGLEQTPVEKVEEVEVEKKGKEKQEEGQEEGQGEGSPVSEEKTPASGGAN